MSLDYQLAARDLREDTQLASLELSLEANGLAGQCEDGYGCAYDAHQQQIGYRRRPRLARRGPARRRCRLDR